MNGDSHDLKSEFEKELHRENIRTLLDLIDPTKDDFSEDEINQLFKVFPHLMNENKK